MKTAITFLLLAILTGRATDIFGHHAPFSYDLEQSVAIRGAVSDVRWGNPHVEIVVRGEDDSGSDVEWVLWSLPPHSLDRRGISVSDFGLGQEVEFQVYPSIESGRIFGWIQSVRIGGGPVRELPEQGTFTPTNPE